MSRGDPNPRRVALALGASRVGLGVGALFLTRPALTALGFGDAGSAGRALAKLLGGRDLALGLATLAARQDAGRLRELTLAAAALDTADAIAMALAARDPEVRLAALGGVLSGGGAAAAGLWAGRRLTA
jgi:hypothetical protein